jgi:molybdopterin-guanine dinucleotide biosynthesis protein A
VIADSALILGGGKGSRIGYDKKKLVLNGVPVLESMIWRLSSVFSEVLLSSNNPVDAGRAKVIPDILGAGPLAGIYAGLCACGSDYLFVCACDMPFIDTGFARYVRGCIEEDVAGNAGKDVYLYRAGGKAGIKSSGFEPFNAFYRKTIIQNAKTALENGRYKLTPLFEEVSLRVIGEDELKPFGGEKMFFNINCPADLETVQKERLP